MKSFVLTAKSSYNWDEALEYATLGMCDAHREEVVANVFAVKENTPIYSQQDLRNFRDLAWKYHKGVIVKRQQA